VDQLVEVLRQYDSFILTTHEGADADGLGAELALREILRRMEKRVRILNTEPAPERFAFMDPQGSVELWDRARHGGLAENSLLLILDTASEYHIGRVREALALAAGVFVIDHHEKDPFPAFPGLVDPTASSACELVVELAQRLGIPLEGAAARAAYTGICYDTGFFAYAKTSIRTFRAALSLVEAGVAPYRVYQDLNESAPTGTLLLEKQVFATLEFRNGGKTAVQILRRRDLERTGGRFEDGESFVNRPLKSRDVEVSVLVKENDEGRIRCSLRSKGRINVARIARNFGGGGHNSAAGFKSPFSIKDTLGKVLERVTEALAAFPGEDSPPPAGESAGKVREGGGGQAREGRNDRPGPVISPGARLGSQGGDFPPHPCLIAENRSEG
jgi:phosphoesterase RecJ-like protein